MRIHIYFTDIQKWARRWLSNKTHSMFLYTLHSILLDPSNMILCMNDVKMTQGRAKQLSRSKTLFSGLLTWFSSPEPTWWKERRRNKSHVVLWPPCGMCTFTLIHSHSFTHTHTHTHIVTLTLNKTVIIFYMIWNAK